MAFGGWSQQIVVGGKDMHTGNGENFSMCINGPTAGTGAYDWIVNHLGGAATVSDNSGTISVP